MSASASGFLHTVGSKRSVWEGYSKHTPGGLTKGDLMKNSHGRIVSKRQHASGKRSLARNMKKPGFRTAWNKNAAAVASGRSPARRSRSKSKSKGRR